MGRCIISSYYKFQLIKNDSEIYRLRPLCRYLNNDSFNVIFENPDGCQIKLVGPSYSMYGYLGYSFRFKNYDDGEGLIVLSSSTQMFPWGVGRVRGGKDAFIFRVDSENIIEIFVCPEMSDQSYQLLVSVQDGTGGMREEIDRIYSAIQNSEEE